MGYYIRVLSTGTEAVPVSDVERALAAAGLTATLEVEDLDAHELLSAADVEDEWGDDEPTEITPPPNGTDAPRDASADATEPAIPAASDARANAAAEPAPSAPEAAAVPVDPALLRGWKFLLVRHASGAPIAEIERSPVLPRSPGAEELAELTREASEGEPTAAAAWLERWLPRTRTVYALRILSGAELPGAWDAILAVRDALWRSAEGLLQVDLEGFTNTAGDYVLSQFDDDAEGEARVAVLGDDGATWHPFTLDLADPAQRAAFLAGRRPDALGTAADAPTASA